MQGPVQACGAPQDLRTGTGQSADVENSAGSQSVQQSGGACDRLASPGAAQKAGMQKHDGSAYGVMLTKSGQAGSVTGFLHQGRACFIWQLLLLSGASLQGGGTRSAQSMRCALLALLQRRCLSRPAGPTVRRHAAQAKQLHCDCTSGECGSDCSRQHFTSSSHALQA